MIADTITLSDWKIEDLHYWIKLATDLSVIILLTSLAIVLIERLIARLTQSANVPKLAFRPILILIRSLIFIFFVAVLLKRVFDLDLITIMSGIIALVAVAFVAFWSVLSSVTCTFLLILFRPFAMGDHVEIKGDGVAGEVCDLNLLFTTLRAEDGRQVQVPNNLFFQKVIIRRKGAKGKTLEEQLASNQ